MYRTKAADPNASNPTTNVRLTEPRRLMKSRAVKTFTMGSAPMARRTPVGHQSSVKARIAPKLRATIATKLMTLVTRMRGARTLHLLVVRGLQAGRQDPTEGDRW